MRTMLTIRVPVEAGNRAIVENTLGGVIEATIADIKPEAAYFYAEDGVRISRMVFDLKQSSDIPRIAEPLFIKLGAAVEFTPVMTLEELGAGLSQLKR